MLSVKQQQKTDKHFHWAFTAHAFLGTFALYSHRYMLLETFALYSHRYMLLETFALYSHRCMLLETFASYSHRYMLLETFALSCHGYTLLKTAKQDHTQNLTYNWLSIQILITGPHHNECQNVSQVLLFTAWTTWNKVLLPLHPTPSQKTHTPAMLVWTIDWLVKQCGQ